MRDVQHRLVALGFIVGSDELGEYGDDTSAAVKAFQHDRGLHADGVCGPATWSAIVEAGYRLGDRPLYLATPMLRGDDVGELQRRLGCLGFDAGRVDGIFGPRTERALGDFQRNGGLITDAVCGPATLAALARLGASAGSSAGPRGSRGAGGFDHAGPEGDRDVGSVAAVWEKERHRRRPPTLAGRTIAVGETGGLDALVRAVAGGLVAAGGRTVLVQHPDESMHAAEANALDVDAYVGLSVEHVADGACSTAYYRSPSGWESPEGRRLAGLVQAAILPVLGASDGGARGMAVPVLRETRMPAVVCELGSATVVVQRSGELAAAVTGALRRWVAPEE